MANNQCTFLPVDAQLEPQRPWLLLLPIMALTPGATYFVIVMIGLLFDIVGPARWLVEEVLTTGWSVPILLALVMGGPVLSAVGSLVVRLGPRPGHRLAGICGGIAACSFYSTHCSGYSFCPLVSFWTDRDGI